MNNKGFEVLGGCFLATIVIIISTTLSALLTGWVASILWTWFAVEIFGLPSLSIAQSIGVCLLISFLTKTYVPSKETKDGNFDWGVLSYVFISPFITLFLGWIIHSFFIVG